MRGLGRNGWIARVLKEAVVRPGDAIELIADAGAPVSDKVQ
ncbi:MAG: hypothetical protein JWN51_350 [Phycisphaerales bacterium]|nr:hypothetical protein [Phycisphaerales bacterium]